MAHAIIEGRYEYLKRTRIKTDQCTFIKAHDKHSFNIIKELGLEGANSVKTPDLAEERPPHSPPLTTDQPDKRSALTALVLALQNEQGATTTVPTAENLPTTLSPVLFATKISVLIVLCIIVLFAMCMVAKFCKGKQKESVLEKFPDEEACIHGNMIYYLRDGKVVHLNKECRTIPSTSQSKIRKQRICSTCWQESQEKVGLERHGCEESDLALASMRRR